MGIAGMGIGMIAGTLGVLAAAFALFVYFFIQAR